MADAAASREPPATPQADQLGAILALCRAARPTPGGPEARELNQLLAAAADAGGAGARERIAQALGDVDWLAPRPPPEPRLPQDPYADLREFAPGGDRAADERRLVDKLAASGQLRPGLLLRALREGRPDLFHAALAALGGFDREELERAVTAEPEHLACALRAVGVDRSIYPTVVEHLRALGDGRPRERRGTAEAVAAAFRLSAGEAAARARAAGAPA